MKSARSGKESGVPTRSAVAEEIAVHASKLARTAKQNGFSLLAYLIDMAVLEAWREAGDSRGIPAVVDCPNDSAKGSDGDR